MLISENRWRAQRYGLDEGLLDFGKGAIVPSGELMEELIDLIGEDAAALGCTDEVARIRTIVSDGTSAHMQVATYNAAIEGGAEPKQALDAVVDMLIDETVRGV
jgi:carboxylate-amine ligase